MNIRSGKYVLFRYYACGNDEDADQLLISVTDFRDDQMILDNIRCLVRDL